MVLFQAQCSACNQFGNVEKICENKKEQQSQQQAQITKNQQQKHYEYLFTAVSY